MNANSPSEALWEVLHQARALLTDGGWAEPLPPRPSPAGSPASTSAPGEAYDDLASRWSEHLAFGSAWPSGAGSSKPQALILTTSPLSELATVFVRSWFENPRVNLLLARDFFIQPLPDFTPGPSLAAMLRELCGLLKPKALLSLGALPAQRLLGAPLSLDTLRGSDYRFDRWTMVTTLDPEEFPALDEAERTRFKGQVWKDLQRLLGKLKYA